MKKNFCIGVDARFYGEAGPGRYVKNIVEHLEKVDKDNKYYIFLRKKGFENYTPHNPNFIKILTDVKWYTWYEQIVFLYYILRTSLDLLYVPHFNIPVLYPFKIVTAIPDIIMHTYSTEKGTTLPKPYFRFKKFIYRLVLIWALIRSKYTIVPSNDVREDILRHYSFLNPNKLVLAYEGVDPVFTDSPLKEVNLDEFGIKSDYLLYISSMYEHKNVKRLIDAFELLVKKFGYKGQLILIGKKDKFSSDINNYVNSKGLADLIVMPGEKRYIDDKESLSFRKRATLYIFPSLKEGFSLTPLEAQVADLPCVISDIPCHREVFGESVVYFDPYSIEDIANKINDLLHDFDKQNHLKTLGHVQVKKYDWTNTAEITKDIFYKVLNG